MYPRPWSLALFMSELNLRNSRHYVAARVGGAVVGYGGLMFTGDEAHVTNIAVDPAWHRHQIGTRLLLNLARASIARGARHLTLEVRVSNAGAQAMYRRFGFETAGVRKNYYAETNEDALIMWAHDIDTTRLRRAAGRPSRPAWSGPPSTRPWPCAHDGPGPVTAGHPAPPGHADPRHRDLLRRDGRGGGRGRPDHQELGGVQPDRPARRLRRGGARDRRPGPRRPAHARSSAEALEIADATPGDLARRGRHHGPRPDRLAARRGERGQGLRPGVGGPVHRGQPSRGPSPRRLPRGSGPGPAGGGAGGVGRPHPAHPHARAGPLPAARPDHRRRRRRGLRQGGAVTWASATRVGPPSRRPRPTAIPGRSRSRGVCATRATTFPSAA